MAKYESFGENIPLGEPSWYMGLNTAYYKPTHVAWRRRVREFVEDVVDPVVTDWDKAAVQDNHEKCKGYLSKVYKECGKRGLLPACVGHPWPAGAEAPAPEGYDHFHMLITTDELTRPSGGVAWALTGGLGIGLPPVVNFGLPGNRALQERCVRECLSGDKMICLAITEPTAGSDVASLSTVAEDKGDHFLVNGEKKWITNGIYAEYFTVAVRTGGPASGHKSTSMLLIDRSMQGVETRKMDCTGVWPSGTTFVTFTDVKVPKGNVIGKVGEGFKQIMFNFNHERFGIAVQASRLARTCIEEALRFARSRKTFGKFLIEHQVIQHKIGEMGRQVEATWALIENITYQMNTMSMMEQNMRLGGYIALLKVQCTKTAEFCAREAVQVFGGAGYTRTGKGDKVERIYREVKACAIPGGSEEIMLNLACTQLRFVAKKTPDKREAAIKKLQAEVASLKKQLSQTQVVSASSSKL